MSKTKWFGGVIVIRRIKRASWMILSILCLIILSVGCEKTEEIPTKVVAGGFDQDLANLFPKLEGTTWSYYGTADYAQHMSIEKIYEANSQKVIKVKGEVDDLSGMSNNLDYRLEVTYAIESDRVTQTKMSDAMMDSEYDKLTLIMAPLEKGNKWREEVIDSQGKKVTLNGEIIEITEQPEGKIYKVLYKESDSDYSEVRKIQEGKGVVDFVKTLKYQNESMEMAYHLYEMNQGKDSYNLGTDNSEIDKIKGTIFKYDELWVDFVNRGDVGIMEYVIAGSPVANMISSFVRDGTKQKYLGIEIKSVNINGAEATADVYEKLEQTKDGESEVKEYEWVYKLQKIGEQWYIHSYVAK